MTCADPEEGGAKNVRTPITLENYKKYRIPKQKVSEYDQEIPQSHTADLTTAP